MDKEVTLLVYQQLSDGNRTLLIIFQSVLTLKFWHTCRHFQKGYLKSISQFLEKFVRFERKIEIIPPENIEKITQFSRNGTAIIGQQGIRASKMAFGGLKLISKHNCFCYSYACQFLDRLLGSFFVFCNLLQCPFPQRNCTILPCAEPEVPQSPDARLS